MTMPSSQRKSEYISYKCQHTCDTHAVHIQHTCSIHAAHIANCKWTLSGFPGAGTRQTGERHGKKNYQLNTGNSTFQLHGGTDTLSVRPDGLAVRYFQESRHSYMREGTEDMRTVPPECRSVQQAVRNKERPLGCRIQTRQQLRTAFDKICSRTELKEVGT